MNRLGRIARLHCQPEACVQVINTLYGFNAMEVQEAFVKVICQTDICCTSSRANQPALDMPVLPHVQVREQAKAFLQKQEDHIQGLNLINSTNLDYFQPQHQAEMINLKAQFFSALGEKDTGKEASRRTLSC